MVEKTLFPPCAGFSYYDSPKIMGILNLAPDSFCPTNRVSEVEAAIKQGIQLVNDGADIIDIGAEPTNPSLHPILPESIELERLLPVVAGLSQEIDVPISVDTSKASIMEAVVAQGASIINDVRALREPRALDVAADLGVDVCLMHMQYPHGKSKNAQPIDDIVTEVQQFLQQRIEDCTAAGISVDKIIVDPGIGAGSFGKTMNDNFLLLKHLSRLKTFGLPILIGTSNKTFIGEFFDADVDERLIGSLASGLYGLLQGANIIRAHDVRATRQMIDMLQAIEGASQ